jgi:glycosyltransferase involved in cell wall biosynthesis
MIVILLEDEQMRRRLGQRGRRFAEQRFNWQVAIDRLDQIEQLLSQRRDGVIFEDL